MTCLPGEDGDLDVCPRCQGRVFEAEKQIAKPGSYHRKCFTCAECRHQMDPTNFANGPDNEIYCIYCYEHIHGMTKRWKMAEGRAKGQEAASWQVQHWRYPSLWEPI